MRSRLITLRHQLSLRKFLTVLGAEASRRVLNRDSVFTYAQSGEDILAMSLLGWPTSGFYVDVGCNLPILRSNTFLFYLRGFRGLGIDANNEFSTAWETTRPRDRFVSACIGHGESVEFNVFESHALSRVGDGKVDGLDDSQYALKRKAVVKTQPLQEILETCAVPKRFDLLSIDVEGQDEQVLDTVDLNKYQPRLIVIEAHYTDLMQLSDHPVVQRLVVLGYELTAVQKSNLFFLRE